MNLLDDPEVGFLIREELIGTAGLATAATLTLLGLHIGEQWVERQLGGFRRKDVPPTRRRARRTGSGGSSAGGDNERRGNEEGRPARRAW
jgi:hypothetical protein